MSADCVQRPGTPAHVPHVPQEPRPPESPGTSGSSELPCSCVKSASSDAPEANETNEAPETNERPVGVSPGAIEIVPMRWWHIPEVAAIEARIEGQDTWSQEMFWSELAQAPTRHYLIAVRDGRVVGYAGLAAHADESFVQTIGVDTGERRRGVAAWLLAALLRHARAVGALSCGLEVRTDNHAARALYGRFGFVDIGLRRGYYQPSGGDAYVMRVRPINTVGYTALLDGISPAGEVDLGGDAAVSRRGGGGDVVGRGSPAAGRGRGRGRGDVESGRGGGAW